MRLNYFNFKPFRGGILLTNDLGKYIFVEKDDFKRIVSKQIMPGEDLEHRLLETGMIYNETNLEFSSVERYPLREIKRYLSTATSLHIFVVTTACNMACVYCQANNGHKCSNLYMDMETARHAVDIALQSPTKYLSFEFQGGEPLLNFELIRYMVDYAEQNKGMHEISYNIVTNLTLLTDEIAGYIVEQNIGVSTSIDGHQLLHDKNYRTGGETYQKVIESVRKLNNMGLKVGAIQTTTRESLKYPKEIVRTYQKLGFESIFIRPLTPLGKAQMNWDAIGYTAEEYLRFYFQCLDELLLINQEGFYLKENHASILLGRIKGHFINYMELRSPCGAGIGQIAYYADGNIFTCDEGRMLYEMGSDEFLLGNINSSSYSDLVSGSVCKAVCAASILESIPSCCDCVYQPYCGTCPVVNFAQNGDILEKQPKGYRCQIYSGMLDYLFGKLLDNDTAVKQILDMWSD